MASCIISLSAYNIVNYLIMYQFTRLIYNQHNKVSVGMTIAIAHHRLNG